MRARWWRDGVAVLALAAFYSVTGAEFALADNCGSFSDCFFTADGAIWAMLGTFVSLGLDFVPVVGTVKGLIEAYTGRDLITGDELEDWERALGVLGAWGDGFRLVAKFDELADGIVVIRHMDDAGNIRGPRVEVEVPGLRRGEVPDRPRVPDDPPTRVPEGDPPGPPRLTPDDVAAIEDYTGAGYSDINHALRSGDPAELAAVQDRVDAISDALDKLPPHQGTVFRGTDLPPDVLARYQPGDVVTEAAFTSTSVDPTKAFPGNTDFYIESISGRDVSALSTHAHESEVLFDAGTRFEVVDRVVNPVTGKTEIYMVEVP